ncbi:hypothetical protein EVC30_048 [Rhizobium phage RHph_Y1_11]|nr:hypothetical protein EVC30_048 [Rhizobium phage RHph_Y1_11]
MTPNGVGPLSEPTTPTDAELAEAVADATRSLNDAIGKADAATLKVSVEVRERLSMTQRYPVVQVEVWKPLI